MAKTRKNQIEKTWDASEVIKTMVVHNDPVEGIDKPVEKKEKAVGYILVINKRVDQLRETFKLRPSMYFVDRYYPKEDRYEDVFSEKGDLPDLKLKKIEMEKHGLKYSWVEE